MTKDGQQGNVMLLESLGFVPTTRQGFTVWRLRLHSTSSELSSTAAPKRAASSHARPWSLLSFEIIERRGHLSIHGIELILAPKSVVSGMEQLTRKYWGIRSNADYAPTAKGAIWCIYEFLHASKRKEGDKREFCQPMAPAISRSGMGGFQTQLAVFGAHISLFASDHFGLGYVPLGFAQTAMRFSADAFGLKDKLQTHLGTAPNAYSVHEWRVPILAIAFQELLDTAENQEVFKATVELWNILKTARGKIQAAFIAESETSRLVVKSGDEARHLPYARSHIPAEVLESRERADHLGSIDRALFQGKSILAAKVIETNLQSVTQDLFLLRRLALLGVAGQREEWRQDALSRQTENGLILKALESEPESMIFLSDALRMALQQSQHHTILTIMSRLGSLLAGHIPQVESLKTFDVIIPEMLGDAWKEEDPRKAEECYRRILQKRGDLPRVLRKLTQIARSAGRTDNEIGYLQRLICVERRHSELAKIHLRLAELRASAPQGREEAIHLAMSALKLDASLVEAAFFAAELLVGQGRSEEAIYLLDAQLTCTGGDSAARDQSRIQEVIGRIWLSSRSRSDLALLRFERAVQLDAHNVSAIRALQTMYRQSASWVKLGETLEKELFFLEVTQDHQRIKVVFDELVLLLQGELSDPKRAYDLYLRLVASAGLDPQEIERVLSWEDIEIDWSDLYHRLLHFLSHIPPGERRARFLCRLAAIARDKLDLSDTSTHHLQEALSEGTIDSSSFGVLSRDLRQMRDYSSLVSAFEKRLSTVFGSERLDLLYQYLEIPEGLSEGRRDELALEIFSLDLGHEGTLQRRFFAYQEMDDVEGIGHLATRLTSVSGLSRFQRAKWIRYAIELLAGCLDENRFPAADRLYKILLDETEDPTIVLQEAVNFLRNAPDSGYMLSHVEKLISANVVPNLEERFVTKLLHGHDMYLAFYLRLLALSEAAADIASGHARIAAHIFSKKGESDLAEEMIGRVCSLTPCSDQDLEELSAFVEASGHWSLLAKAYEVQIKFEDEKNRKLGLLLHLGRLYRSHLRNYDQARLVMVQALNDSPFPWKVRRELAEIAREEGDLDAEKKAVTQFLLDPGSTKDMNDFGHFFDRLVALGELPQQLLKILIPHIERASLKSRYGNVASLCDLAFRHGIANWILHKVGFQAALRSGKVSGSMDLWWRGLAMVPNGAKAQEYMAEAGALAEQFNQKSLLVACYDVALRQNVMDRLGPRARKEFLFNYASILFDDDQKRQSALPLYEEAFQLDPADSRIWLPLYFVLNEFGSVEKLVSHLEQIVPALLQDQDPLRSFPVTIEFLQGQLANLKEVSSGGDLSRFQEPFPPRAVDLSPREEWGGESSPYGAPDGPGLGHGINLPPLPAEPAALSRFPGALPEVPFAVAEAQNASVTFFEKGAAEDDLAAGGLEHGGGSQVLFRVDAHSGLMSLDLEVKEPSPLLGFELGGVARDLASVAKEMGSSVELRLVGSSPQIPFSEVSLGSEDPSGNTGSHLVLGAQLVASEVDLEGLPSLTFDLMADVQDSLLVGAPPSQSLLDSRSTDAGQGSVSMDILQMPPKEETNTGGHPSGGVFQLHESVDPAKRDDQPPESSLQSGEVEISEPESRIGDVYPSESKFVIEETSPVGVSILPSSEYGDEVIDWRTAILSADFNANLTDRLLGQAFASEIEKHLAIQCVALVAGNVSRLMGSWHWRVWRKAEEYGYPLHAKERYPRGLTSPLLHSPLAKLIIALGPLLVRSYSDRFSLQYLGARLRTKIRTIEKLRKPLAWDQGVLKKVGLALFAQRIMERKLLAYNLPSLGPELFLDLATNALYLDEAYYQASPPSHLFHRVLELMWMLRFQYYVPLKLNAKQEIYEAIVAVQERLNSRGIVRLAQNLVPKRTPMGRVLAKFDVSHLRTHFEKSGVPKPEQIQELHRAMRTQLYRMMVSETLDIIGFFEAILGRDLVNQPLKHSEIYKTTPVAKPLLDFVTKLKV